MSTASLPPKNILLLAALGIGVYWFMTRRAVAANTQAAAVRAQNNSFFASPAIASQLQAQWARNDAALWAGVGNILGSKSGGSSASSGGLFGGSTKTATPNEFQRANAAVAATQTSQPLYGSTPGDPYASDFSQGGGEVAYNPAPGSGDPFYGYAP